MQTKQEPFAQPIQPKQPPKAQPTKLTPEIVRPNINSLGSSINAGKSIAKTKRPNGTARDRKQTQDRKQSKATKAKSKPKPKEPKTPDSSKEGRSTFNEPSTTANTRPAFDLETKEGRKGLLAWLALSNKDADALRALKELDAWAASEKDPDSKTDPAEVCAYLARCQLYGLDPAQVLLTKRGLKRVATALVGSLGFDAISIRMGSEVVSIGSISGDTMADDQCLQGIAPDKQSGGVVEEGA